MVVRSCQMAEDSATQSALTSYTVMHMIYCMVSFHLNLKPTTSSVASTHKYTRTHTHN